MHISKLRIKNFKCFDEVEINFDPNFNLIIGENNSGKSTIFEALRLWQIAVQQFYSARTGKNVKGNIGFYRTFVFQPLNLNDLSFLRIKEIDEVFHNKPHKSLINKHYDVSEDFNSFVIEVTFSNSKDSASIPILFKSNSRKTLNCKIDVSDEDILRKVSNELSMVMELANNDTFRNRIRLAYIPPKFTFPTKEVLFSESNSYISEKLVLGQSQYVIRNILHQWCEYSYQKTTKTIEEEKIRKSITQLEMLQIDKTDFDNQFNDNIRPYIENVLGYNLSIKKKTKSTFLQNVERGLFDILNQEFDFKSKANPIKDYVLHIFNTVDNSEVSQLGSGSINVLNILSVLNFNDQTIENATKCNILLLDEPDSHLHSNLQIKLFKYLEKESQSEKKQIFIITHNTTLISQFDKVLFIKKNLKHYSPITYDYYLENILKDLDECHYRIMKELASYKNRLKDIEVNIEDDSRVCLLLEGPTDFKIIKAAYNKIYGIDIPYYVNEHVTGASAITINLNGSNKKLGYLIGIYDNDHEGRSQFENLRKPPFKAIEDYKQNENKFALLLPVPGFRNIPFYRKHLTIEYLFDDSDLEKILGNDYFIQDEGENYKKIKGDMGKQAYVICDKAKSLISDSCDSLPKESFIAFKLLFDRIESLIS